MAHIYGVTLLASGARTATAASAKMRNRRHKSVLVVLNVSAASGTGGLTLHVRGYDTKSGNAFDVLVDGSAITGTGTYGFLVALSSTAASGIRIAKSAVLPRDWDVQVVHGDTSSYTYSVIAELIP